MEPTLMSVLAVKSLEKLELVGDHRQLPAFVQDYWYDIGMTHTSIKTSLFERLVMGGDTGYGKRKSKKNNINELSERLECTVLDEQRRMITEIADITRPEYEDLVDIKDHKCCQTQLIGDRYLKALGKSKSTEASSFQSLRKTWVGQGREVPGVPSSVFFWSLKDNKESRPVAGLSSCNKMEAEAVTSLCKWFISMGVPRSAISVITPYKGQKNMIIKELRDAKLMSYPSQNKDFNDKNRFGSGKNFNSMSEFEDIIVTSTVDRYQGDENDIVILSLVKTRSGNAFVSLPNRYVVGTSRARLGFYIVGSTEAIKGADHWQRCINSLKCQPCASGGAVTTELSRVGEKFPLCCPVHKQETQRNVSNSGDFPKFDQWSSFCKVPCPTVLDRCGHHCGFTCHYNQPLKHNTKCQESLRRPCDHHAHLPLLCHMAKLDGPLKSEDANQAVKRGFECEISTELKRAECNHEVTLLCHVKEKVLSGEKKLDPCQEKVSDYVHPSCNHVFKKLRCHEKLGYEKKPPRCNTVLDKKLTCSHNIKLKCYELIENPSLLLELANKCKEEVTLERPRCFHLFSSRCHVNHQLAKLWEEASGQSAEIIENNSQNKRTPRVEFGRHYGKAESDFGCNLLGVSIPKCQGDVEYVRKCGHIEPDVKCNLAFDYAENDECGIPECDQLKELDCPFCLHTIKVPCKFKNSIEQLSPYQTIGGGGIIFHRDEFGLISLDENDFDNVDISKLNNRLTRMLQKQCNKFISLKRKCGDVEQIKCSKLISLLLKKESLHKCEKPRVKQLDCGHEIKIKCFERNNISRDFVCNEQVNDFHMYPCGLHQVKAGSCSNLSRLRHDNPKCPEYVSAKLPRCGHVSKVSCMDKCEAETNTMVGSEVLSKMPTHQSVTVAAQQDINHHLSVVSSGGHYEMENEHNKRCEENVMYQFSCGHYWPQPIKCCEAFRWAHDDELEPKCSAKGIMKCHPVCKHEKDVICYMKKDFVSWAPWQSYMDANNIPQLESETEMIDSHGNAAVSSFLQEFEGNKPSDIVPVEYSESCKCTEKVIYKRLCGHSVNSALCSDAFFGNVGHCQELVNMPCRAKIPPYHAKQIPCHAALEQRRTGNYDKCRCKVSKLCNICYVNETDVECFKEVVQCSKLVTAKLPCGHEVNWFCGEQEDPRIGNHYCRLCIEPQWEEAVNYAPSDDAKMHFIAKCRMKMDSQFKDLNLTVMSSKEYDIDLDNVSQHNRARLNILKIRKDLISKLPIEKVKPPPVNIGEEADLSQYELVFVEVKDDEANINENKDYEKYFLANTTQYGRGCAFYDLNSKNISDANSKSAEMNMVVGIAFRQHLIEDAPPFAANKKSKGNPSNKMQEINKKMKIQQLSGYDCIASNVKEDMGKILYWYPRAVLPLGYVSVTVNEKCLVCMELCPSALGSACSNKHFICWECINDYIESNINRPPTGRDINEVTGELKCAAGCDQCYTLALMKENDEALENISKLKAKVKAEKESKLATINEKQRLMAEFEKIQSIKNVEKRTAYTLRQDIANNILTLKCPRCSAAFLDFGGCFALSCASCPCGFCAWCLKDCGADAHAHVLQCPENVSTGRSYHGTLEQFESHHAVRKGKLIDAKLHDAENDMVAAITFQLLKTDIDDTKIKLQFIPRVNDNEIEAHIKDTGGGTGVGMDSKKWKVSTPVDKRAGCGLNVYTIHASEVTSQASRETFEFNASSGQFMRLIRNYDIDIQRVDVLEYAENSPIRKAYQKEKAKFPPNEKDAKSSELLVFHGTALENVDKIINGGFKVGGSEGVGIANGALHGNGVYTATGPDTPMAFARNGRCVILSTGLLCGADGHSMPHGDFVVFKRSSQLLPSYVLYY